MRVTLNGNEYRASDNATQTTSLIKLLTAKIMALLRAVPKG